MAYTPYSTHEMLSVIRNIPAPSNFWMRFFGQQVNSQNQYIDFDTIDRGRRLAPFVAPTVAGKAMKAQGYETRRFAPAYIKPKHVVDPERVIARRAGEEYTGSMSLQARRDAIVSDILTEQRDMINRRWELMAAQAIIDGQVVVEGDDYPTQTISFGRAAGQSVTNSGTDLWTDAASKPYQQMEDLSIQTQRASGYAITDWILGANAWAALAEHADTEKLLRTDLANGSASLQMGPGDIPNDGAIVQLKGTVGVGIRIWTYADIYEDESGTVQDIMDPNLVIGLNPQGIEGVRCFGAIMDAEAGYQSMSIFPKNWMNNDPSVEYVMSQSAPLMVPKRPNATLKLKAV